MWYVWILVASSACAMPAQPDPAPLPAPATTAAPAMGGHPASSPSPAMLQGVYARSSSEMSDLLASPAANIISKPSEDAAVLENLSSKLALPVKVTVTTEKSSVNSHVPSDKESPAKPLVSSTASDVPFDKKSSSDLPSEKPDAPPPKELPAQPADTSDKQSAKPDVPSKAEARTETPVASKKLRQAAAGGQAGAGAGVATPRPPARTLDRAAAELVWRAWLQSPESGSQNAPPRRITTKSLFITPLVCPKGQRLDRDSCIQVLSVNKDEHERILLEQLQGLFAPPDVQYDYGEEEAAAGPLQLTIPIGLEPAPQPQPLLNPLAQNHDVDLMHINKKDEDKPNAPESLEAELELLKLPHKHNPNATKQGSSRLPAAEKPKRDSHISAETTTEVSSEQYETTTDAGEKEVIYGHISVDPVLAQQDEFNYGSYYAEGSTTTDSTESTTTEREGTTDVTGTPPTTEISYTTEAGADAAHELTRTENTHLNPETEYSDIGEAIKLISRYAEVTTDDTYAKNERNRVTNNHNVLGTRTRLQHRRGKPKKPAAAPLPKPFENMQDSAGNKELFSFYPNKEPYYFRYPWRSEWAPTPPPEYPFRHVQDYWRGRGRLGLYSQNPRRHHHAAAPARYSADRRTPPAPQQDLYSLLGLRHWLSGEALAKR